ncbi:MAG: hypothetical protein MPJ08_02065 [Nitrosopumilus sp.]|nr:hypothetical protein [Nitrosopumilus sp.]
MVAGHQAWESGVGHTTASLIFGRLKAPLGKGGKILQDSPRFSKILQDSPRFSKIMTTAPYVEGCPVPDQEEVWFSEEKLKKISARVRSG